MNRSAFDSRTGAAKHLSVDKGVRRWVRVPAHGLFTGITLNGRAGDSKPPDSGFDSRYAPNSFFNGVNSDDVGCYSSATVNRRDYGSSPIFCLFME